MRQSVRAPFFAGVGRDEIRYYGNGRSVSIHAEMQMGPVQRRIYPQMLKWRDSGLPLTDGEQSELMDSFFRFLASKSITWETYG
jgi:hypothetical protein